MTPRSHCIACLGIAESGSVEIKVPVGSKLSRLVVGGDNPFLVVEETDSPVLEETRAWIVPEGNRGRFAEPGYTTSLVDSFVYPSNRDGIVPRDADGWLACIYHVVELIDVEGKPVRTPLGK